MYTYIFYSTTGAVIEIVRGPIIFTEAGQACLGGVTSMEYLPEICSNRKETYDVMIIMYIKYIQFTMSHIKTVMLIRSKGL